ncbi:ATP-binding protein [Nitriliruptoraceae bacterium ZYF776]|nr:ATP-binding protein [Profundirhabdus halotolerans]
MVEYLRRAVDDDLDELFGQLPAVLLDGAKGVGKTETALQRAGTVRRLDEPPVREIAAADVDQMLRGNPPVLLDEWQHAPDVWDAVKRAVDRDSTGGRFLLTGSLPPRRTHSGAGRITVMRMRPLTLAERGHPTSVSLAGLLHGRAEVRGDTDLSLAGYVDEILASGLPGLRHLTGRALQAQLDGYLDRIVDRDMAEAGLKVRRPETVRGWLRAYAAAVATVTSAEKIRRAATGGDDAGLPRSTTLPYTETLTAVRVLDELPAWSPGHNHLRRLTQGAKHHLADPALAARLVGHSRDKLLGGARAPYGGDGTYLGQLFESLATLSVRVFAQSADARVFHVRTRDAEHEIDLLVERDDGGVVALEVKLSATVDDDDVKHLHWLEGRIGEQLLDKVVLTTGPSAYRRADGVAVIPLVLLGT